MRGSLTGVVASQRVTEAREGGFKLVIMPIVECNGKNLLDCKMDISSRDVSRP